MKQLSKTNLLLLRELVRTDFKLRYQGSLIGHLWSILKPMMLFAIMYTVFVKFLRFDDGMPHSAVGMMLGTVTWSFFSEATNMGMMSIVSRGDLLRKLNFPKHIVVFSAVTGAAINYGINLLVVLVFGLLSGIDLSLRVLFVLPLVGELILLAAGLALVLSSLFVRYRDIGPVWEVVLQAGMYASPVIYTLTYVVQRDQVFLAKAMMMNPIAQIIQDLRHVLIYPGNLRVTDVVQNPLLASIPYLLPLVIFGIGYAIFSKHAKRFAEIL